MRDRIGQEIRVGDVVLTGRAGGGFQKNVVVRILRDEIAQCRFASVPLESREPGYDFDFGAHSNDLIVDATARD